MKVQKKTRLTEETDKDKIVLILGTELLYFKLLKITNAYILAQVF